MSLLHSGMRISDTGSGSEVNKQDAPHESRSEAANESGKSEFDHRLDELESSAPVSSEEKTAKKEAAGGGGDGPKPPDDPDEKDRGKETDSVSGHEAGGDDSRSKDAVEKKSSIEGSIKELPRQELSERDKNSFRNGEYRTVEATEDITGYRVYGGESDRVGGYITTQRPTDRMEAKLDLALPSKVVDKELWANTRETYCEVTIPKGTVFNIGIAAEQKTSDGTIFPGGAEQILVSTELKENHFGEEHQLDFKTNYPEFEKRLRDLGY